MVLKILLLLVQHQPIVVLKKQLLIVFSADRRLGGGVNGSISRAVKLEVKKSKDLGIVENEKLNIPQICKSFSCTDKIEIKEYINETSGEIKYRLRNNWFNHQGIILDNFLKTKDSITITTFESQAYFLESYFIDRETGNTKRKIYRFDDTVFLSKIKELEKDFSKDKPIYNKT